MRVYHGKLTLTISSRLDLTLASEVKELSRTKIQELIKSEKVKINGQKEVNCKKQIIGEIEYDIEVPEPKQHSLSPSYKYDLDILYEDEDLLVINKAAGITVHPGIGSHDDTLVNLLLGRVKNLSSIGEESFRPGIVHRLDRDTSGVMIVAKNDESHNILANAIANKKVRRIYQAIVFGNIPAKEMEIRNNIARSKIDRTRMTIVRTSGKQAVTKVRLIKRFGTKADMIECELETGRTHQIRVQLSNLGHSIVGDQKYGDNSRKARTMAEYVQKFPRQALHARSISFDHPRSGQKLQFAAELPEDFNNLVTILGESYEREKSNIA